MLLTCCTTSHSSSTLAWDDILDVTVSDTATAYDAVSAIAWKLRNSQLNIYVVAEIDVTCIE